MDLREAQATAVLMTSTRPEDALLLRQLQAKCEDLTQEDVRALANLAGRVLLGSAAAAYLARCDE